MIPELYQCQPRDHREETPQDADPRPDVGKSLPVQAHLVNRGDRPVCGGQACGVLRPIGKRRDRGERPADTRRQHDKIDPVRSRFGKIEKEEVTLPEKMEFLAEYTRTHRSFRFRDLLMRQTSKVQVIVTFLAVLEMMKAGKITVRQEDTFGEIMILSKDKEDKDGGDTETRGDH